MQGMALCKCKLLLSRQQEVVLSERTVAFQVYTDTLSPALRRACSSAPTALNTCKQAQSESLEVFLRAGSCQRGDAPALMLLALRQSPHNSARWGKADRIRWSGAPKRRDFIIRAVRWFLRRRRWDCLSGPGLPTNPVLF